MNIVLDTNIFRNDLFLRSQDFKVLKDYLKRTDSKFVFPQIIFEELKGVYRRTINENLMNIEKHRSELNKNLNREYIIRPDLDVENEISDFIDFINKELDIDESNIISYRNDYLPEIIKRAINREKPFKDGDVGFRDAVIWLTILDHCKGNHEKQVIFISNNPKDFGDDKNSSELHKSLKKECDELGIKVNYFKSLKDFIERHSSKMDYINDDWLDKKLFEDNLSERICNEVENLKKHRITSWYKNKTSNESTEFFKVINSFIYELYDLFFYEMANGKIIIKCKVRAELEVEFEFYDYPHNHDNYIYGFDRYRNARTEIKYIECEVFLSIICQNEKIEEIEISDIVF
ncbi:DUF4935 domain-containing protein [Flavobacterium sp. GA093]|uniref:DUF4935 domain-containing protein n=1 Tax=Flavobacterium hydrocarbonoxydans TaxID=2683249 RepID=A0A6I4NKV3_9FLAO|nr:PIN domain-containing protein [Flavobacterium hydrocarbonoxydans]MWB93472.1 DUF4935 domain-containing protein [Flavobacterium hydrocarbonoxydans]